MAAVTKTQLPGQPLDENAPSTASQPACSFSPLLIIYGPLSSRRLTQEKKALGSERPQQCANWCVLSELKFSKISGSNKNSFPISRLSTCHSNSRMALGLLEFIVIKRNTLFDNLGISLGRLTKIQVNKA
ncbi:hypothetical protein HI914_00698 [Erysiphe necator]|nr:hypothetical protein HI914_00698 [Erysiphe necator]